jgi:hypothetical protein
MKSLFLLLVLLLTPLSGWAAEIVIDGPSQPVAVADLVTLSVVGIADADLPRATVSIQPTAGATLRAIRSWSNTPELVFVARSPGSYRITVALNGWREPISEALQQARVATIAARAQVDPVYQREIETLQSRLITSYPVSSASCVVEVAGGNPTPPGPQPPPPAPPSPPPVTAATRALILYENDTKPAWLGAIEVQLRKDLQLSPKVLILDKDAVLPSDEPVPLVVDALRLAGNLPLPVLLWRNAAGSLVGDAEPLPETWSALRDRLKGGGL